ALVAHIGGRAAFKENLARGGEDVDHLAILRGTGLLLDPPGGHADLAPAAHPALLAPAEIPLSPDHPEDLLVRMLVGAGVSAFLVAPPHDHAALAGDDAPRDLGVDALGLDGLQRAEAGERGHGVPPRAFCAGVKHT